MAPFGVGREVVAGGGPSAWRAALLAGGCSAALPLFFVLDPGGAGNTDHTDIFGFVNPLRGSGCNTYCTIGNLHASTFITARPLSGGSRCSYGPAGIVYTGTLAPAGSLGVTGRITHGSAGNVYKGTLDPVLDIVCYPRGACRDSHCPAGDVFAGIFTPYSYITGKCFLVVDPGHAGGSFLAFNPDYTGTYITTT